MIPAAAGLLRLLGSNGGAPARPAERLASTDPDFAALLDKARAGEIHSGRHITVASPADIQLSEDQLQRLAAAADLAEAQGATRALVLIDGQALRLDITVREVTEAVDLARPGVLTNIDAVITVPASAEGSVPAMLPPPGNGRAWSNASLLSALAGGDRNNSNEEAR